MNEALLVALGGLLHDIGKFVQRARWDEKKSHEEWGYEFLYGFKDRNSIFEKLALFARYHHRESLEKADVEDVKMLNLLWIIYEADNLSSMERVGEKPQFGNPMVSVFSSVNLGKGDPETCYYDLKEYDPHTFFKPTIKKITIDKKKYAEQYERFKREFIKLVEKTDFDRILALLEKYTTFIPSVMSGENDVSLYDHLKTTSAIALCLYYYHKNELDRNIKDKILDRNEFKYLLIGGDISGIQDFIYTISSKGALKYLRARSAFLELLTEDVVEEIVERLGLTRANIIYCGGGHFFILAPNTDEAKEELKKIRNSVNQWLFYRYHGRLYLAMGYIKLNGNSFKNLEVNGESIWRKISQKLKIIKNRKFLDILEDSASLVEKDYWRNKDICDVCRSPAKELNFVREDIQVCEACGELYNLGEIIPKIFGFVRWKHDESLRNTFPAITLPFSTFYALYEHEDLSIKKMLKFFPKDAIIYAKNSFDLEEIYYGYRVIPYFVSDYVVKNERGEIKNFDELGESAKGVKKIAVLKMDVDDLGKIFSKGLPEDKRTLSRYATLSRFMNHFFKNCIRLIAKRDGQILDILRDKSLPRLFEDSNERNIVVVYSGGDDLFIVGSWNDVFEIASEIRELFGEYVGWNPNLTISAGFAIFDPKYPLYRMAKITSDRLENAKDEGSKIHEDIKIKDRIMLFERSIPKEFEETHKISYMWKEFKEIWNKYIPKIYENGMLKKDVDISKTILRKILEAREKYVKNPKGLKWHISLIYYLSRAKLIDILGDLAKRDVEKVKSGEPQEIYYIDAPLRVVDLAVRG